MKHRILGAAVLAGVLIAASCSSSDSEGRDSSGSGTTASQAIAASAAPASVAATSSEPAAPGTEETSEPAVTAAPTPTTSGTSASSSTSATSTTTTTSVASSAPSEESGTSEPPSTSTTTTTTSAVPATTTTSSTTTTTTTVAESPAVARGQAGLRPRQRNDVLLPLPDSVPRDRFVPGLANVNIYSRVNDQGSLDLQAKLDELAIFMRYVGNYQPYVGATAENRDTNGTFREVAKLIGDTLLWMGFTPQNVCGAPAGYSFTDLLQPTREWSEELKVYSGDAIFTTDRLIELHGGQRINPSENLDFYISEAVQTAHDALRLPELLDETEAPQLILCRSFLAPSGEVPEFANGAWYAQLTPGVQPRESLLSQGTYHLKEISKNGNMAYVLVCHSTLGSRYVDLAWRDAGYRAEVVGTLRTNGCQTNFERRGYIADYEPEETIRFSFGERSFAASDLQGFPRAGG